MYKKHYGRLEDCCEESRKLLMETIEHVHSRFHKNDLSHFSSQQLDDLKDCYEILDLIDDLEDEYAHLHGHGHMHGHDAEKSGMTAVA